MEHILFAKVYYPFLILSWRLNSLAAQEQYLLVPFDVELSFDGLMQPRAGENGRHIDNSEWIIGPSHDYLDEGDFVAGGRIAFIAC